GHRRALPVAFRLPIGAERRHPAIQSIDAQWIVWAYMGRVVTPDGDAPGEEHGQRRRLVAVDGQVGERAAERPSQTLRRFEAGLRIHRVSGGVSELEVEMMGGVLGVSRVSHPADDLSGRHPVAFPEVGANTEAVAV